MSQNYISCKKGAQCLHCVKWEVWCEASAVPATVKMSWLHMPLYSGRR